MDRLDCRAVAPDELYSTICQRYDAAAIGEQFEVFTDDLPAGVRIGMIEAGVRFTAERSDGEWSCNVRRHRP